MARASVRPRINALKIIITPLLKRSLVGHGMIRSKSLREFKIEGILNATAQCFGPDWTHFTLLKSFKLSRTAIQHVQRLWFERS
nr:hypothetical protein [uncultured Brevundimonas sp.]